MAPQVVKLRRDWYCRKNIIEPSLIASGKSYVDSRCTRSTTSSDKISYCGVSRKMTNMFMQCLFISALVDRLQEREESFKEFKLTKKTLQLRSSTRCATFRCVGGYDCRYFTREDAQVSEAFGNLSTLTLFEGALNQKD